ncbi:hypothetical protein [Actinophytocola sp.]
MSDEKIGTEDVSVESVDAAAEVVDYGELQFDESEAAERPGAVCNIASL